MLEPENRQLLRELLRPPAGYRFDRAVSTTFSLDLMALLTMPVAFTFFDRQSADGRPVPDPLAMLQALRRYADRIHVFCHAGQIVAPRRHHQLFAYLESSVFGVLPPSEHGVFHPKLTVLRFVEGEQENDGTPEPTVRYRVLCASRNLTFDRSWDTVLTLEGDLAAHRSRAFARNRPLSEFVACLPSLAVQGVPNGASMAVAQVADELLRVTFEEPAGFDDLAFWPLGMEGWSRWPFTGEMKRMLVLSPFVSEGLLERLKAECERRVLISRHESMDALPAAVLEPFECYVMHQTAEPQAPSDDAPDTDAGEPALAEDPAIELTGLHAKLFVADTGHQARVWTGSANATDAAFGSNIEFLVELRGSRKGCGVHRLVRPEDRHGEELDDPQAMHFDQLLQRYEPRDQPVEPNADQQQAERLVARTQRTLAQADLAMHVVTLEDEADETLYRLAVRRPVDQSGRLWPGEVTVQCRPVTLTTSHATQIDAAAVGTVAEFGSVSFRALTSFVVFEVEARVQNATHPSAFVLNLPLHGAPEDRSQRLLLAMLENRQQLLRYLLMLLAEDETDLRQLTSELVAASDADGSASDRGTIGLPLLEPLLKTLDRQPHRLDQIAQLVDDLCRHEQGRALLPDGFLEAWQPIWEARQEALA